MNEAFNNGYNLLRKEINRLKAERDELVTKCHRLEQERDAAVADIKEISFCCNCKQCTDKDGGDIWCSAYGDWFEWYDTCDEWQWRGLSLAAETSDKKEEEE